MNMTPQILDGNPRHTRFLRTRFFSSLDGLRFFSIVSVMAFHLGWPHLGARHWGDKGVQFFFCISGFLITTLLLREQAERGSISLRNFYIRRVLRIFPLYYAVLLIYVILIWTFQRHEPAGQLFFQNLPSFATYTSNWFMKYESHVDVHFWLSWSLATEEQFYLVWPVVIFLSGRKWQIPVIFMLLLASVEETLKYLVGAGIVDCGLPGNTILTSVATTICLGSLLAYAFHHPGSFKRCWALFGQVWSVPAAAIVLAVALYLKSTPDLPIYAAMIWFLGSVCIREDHALKPILASAPMRYLGTISYGMYLLHMLCRSALQKYLIDKPTLFLIATVALTAAAASVSYYLYERQFLKMKHRFSAAGKAGRVTNVIEKPNEPLPAQDGVALASSR